MSRALPPPPSQQVPVQAVHASNALPFTSLGIMECTSDAYRAADSVAAPLSSFREQTRLSLSPARVRAFAVVIGDWDLANTMAVGHIPMHAVRRHPPQARHSHLEGEESEHG